MADGFAHLKETFDLSSKGFPDIMEPFQIMMADAEGDQVMQTEIMREGLRSTFNRRYPSRRRQV